MATPGQFITQTDVDDLATLASDKCVPQVMSTPMSSPVTYDAATFSFETLAGANSAAWITEINRIWYSLFDVGQLPSPDQVEYSLTYSGIDYFSTMDRIGEVMQYWWVAVPDRETVVSCGPHLWSYCQSVTGSTYWQCKAFQGAKFIFSRIDCPDFYLRPGFILGTIEQPAEILQSGGAGTSGSPVYVDIDYNLASGILYGDIWAEFVAPTPGAGAGPPSTSDIGFSGWGTGGSGTWEFVSGSTWRIHLGYQGIKNTIDNSGSPASGTFHLQAYVDDAGWSPAAPAFGAIGVIQTDTELQASVDAVATTYNVVSPRNGAMRQKVHLTFDPHFRLIVDGFHDIVDANAFIIKLRDAGASGFPETTSPSHYLYGVILNPLETWIDEYPGGANDALIEPALIDVLNDLIDGDNLFNSGAWGGVSLRASTAWLLARNPTGLFLQLLNRLLLEDAYPDELLRIPEESFDITEEIGELTIPDIDAYRVESPGGYYFGHYPAGAFCTLVADEDENPVPSVAGIYVATAWPQAFHHSFLDFNLPNYWNGAQWQLSSLRDGSYVFQAGDDITPIGTVFPSAKNLPAHWPVVNVSNFASYAINEENQRNGSALANMQAIVPYWANDSHHTIFDEGYAKIGPAELLTYSHFISDTLGDSVLEKRKLEYTANNESLHIYVAVDVPLPGNPASYLFVKTDGVVRFPKDFTDRGLTPSDYYAANLFFGVYNPTSGTLTSHFVRSEFYSSEGEDPPYAEPRFFPRRSRTVTDKYDMKLEASTLGLGELIGDNSYRFTPLDYAPFWGGSDLRAMPIPDRGYCIVGLVIQNKSQPNEKNIQVTPVADSQIKIGVMAGAGVFAGAIWGAYPGEFLEFATYTLSGGESRKVVEVFWPVLDGCPLAFQSVVGEHTVTALVDFQPGVNVGFRGREVAGSDQQGTYSGKPFFQGRFFVAQNLNNPSVVSYEWLLLPPISARSFQDLNWLLLSMPDI